MVELDTYQLHKLKFKSTTAYSFKSRIWKAWPTNIFQGVPYAGLAKPGPVIETFCTDELVSRYVKLDGVVTLVDSKHSMQHLNEVKPRFVVNEAVEQVAYADRIIVNKVKFNYFLK